MGKQLSAESGPELSVIVPASNSAEHLRACLEAIGGSDLPRDRWELIAVDDGSSDATPAIARELADRTVLIPSPPRGPAFARNRGAEVARGDNLVFVDSDVEVHRDAMRLLRDRLGERPDIAAVSGSYDDSPRAPGLVSQFRNLLHHFVHQGNAGLAESFWAGCGIMRRGAFMEAGGFDEIRYTRPQIEDIELGYRLRARGHRLLIDPLVLGTHRKRWTLRGMLASDIVGRGVPWTRLLLERRMLFRQSGASMGAADRLSALVVALLGVFAVLSIFLDLRLSAVVLLSVVGFAALNWRFLAWLAQRRGILFAIRAVPLHLLYYAEAAVSLLAGGVLHLFGRRQPRAQPLRTIRL